MHFNRLLKIGSLKKSRRISNASLTIDIKLLVLTLLFTWNVPANAQGIIHLGPGDSYLFTQPTLIMGQIDEGGGTYFSVLVGFNGDLFTAGDSLQMDIFTTPADISPLVTGIVTNPPWTITSAVSIQWLNQLWSAPSGAIRITMLTGSVDISNVGATTAHNFFRGNYSYSVPEPAAASLFAVGVGLLGRACWRKHRKLESCENSPPN